MGISVIAIQNASGGDAEAFSPFIPAMLRIFAPATILRTESQSFGKEVTALSAVLRKTVASIQPRICGVPPQRVKVPQFYHLDLRGTISKNAPRPNAGCVAGFWHFLPDVFWGAGRVATQSQFANDRSTARTRSLQASLMGSILGEITCAGDESAMELAFTGISQIFTVGSLVA